MMGIDRPDAAVAIDVVAAEQQVAQAERKLAVGMPRRVPDFEFQAADLDDIAVVDQRIELHRRHFHVNVLRFDFGKRLQSDRPWPAVRPPWDAH